jgi:predicted amidohydrolase YtcJ
MTIIFRALLLGFFIAFIGLAGCQSEAVPSADLILYNGKMLLPGFIDSHAHLIMGGAYVRSLSLDTYATPAYG